MSYTKIIKPKPACFGTSDVENIGGQYRGKCLICRFEDECVVVYLRSIADKMEHKNEDNMSYAERRVKFGYSVDRKLDEQRRSRS